MNVIQVLLAEDDPGDAPLTLRTLNHVGLSREQAFGAEDGEEAIECLRVEDRVASHLQLVLLGLKLPEVSGLEVLRFWQGQPHTRHLPAMIWGASREDRDIAESYDTGSNRYVAKPVGYPGFSRALESLVQYWLGNNLLPTPAR